MENIDVLVLRHLRDWRAQGESALLATVIRTWGSSPRPVGSILALRENGTLVGSVSGGCIEDDLIQRYTKPQALTAEGGRGHRMPERVSYGVTADEAHRFGLPCGGTLELLLEFNPDAVLLEELVRRLESGEMMQRVTHLADGQVRLRPSAKPEHLSISNTEMVNTFGPEFRMLIIGAGQIADYLGAMASACGFSVTVCDPRGEYTAAWSPSSGKLSREWPDDCVRQFSPDQRSCVVAVSHDPKLDDAALIEALHSTAFYVGAIGSRSNQRERQARLRAHFGVSPLQLEQLRGPIGIFIGSKTPAEIAVSIMAEVLAVKNSVHLPSDFNVGYAKEKLLESFLQTI